MATSTAEDETFLDGIITKLVEEGASGKNVNLRQEDISRVVLKAKDVVLSQPSMLELASPIKILGDIHGYVLHAPKPASLTSRASHFRSDAPFFVVPCAWPTEFATFVP